MIVGLDSLKYLGMPGGQKLQQHFYITVLR